MYVQTTLPAMSHDTEGKEEGERWEDEEMKRWGEVS